MKVLRDETTPEEEMALQQLSEMLEKRNLRPPVPAVRPRAFSLKYLPYGVAGIAALLLTAVLVGRMPFGSSASTPTQIVKALADTVRPFEPRIVGQRYLEVQEVTRSRVNLVPDAIVAQMTESSADSYEMGRFFLLNRDYGKAIKYLKTAVSDPKGVPADVHNDLGVAYLESGEDTFPAAEAEFKDALTREAAHAPALFNLSILYERQGRLAEAVERRQQYLELDPDSGWAKEIQRKLSRKESAEP